MKKPLNPNRGMNKETLQHIKNWMSKYIKEVNEMCEEDGGTTKIHYHEIIDTADDYKIIIELIDKILDQNILL